MQQLTFRQLIGAGLSPQCDSASLCLRLLALRILPPRALRHEGHPCSAEDSSCLRQAHTASHRLRHHAILRTGVADTPTDHQQGYQRPWPCTAALHSGRTDPEDDGRERGQPQHGAPGGGRVHDVDQQSAEDAQANDQLIDAPQSAAHLCRRDLQRTITFYESVFSVPDLGFEMLE